jgi:HPt (histidine-containing phosphotransfer) domain-containing protein
MSGAYRDTDPGVLWRAAAGDASTFGLLARIFLDAGPPALARLRQALAGGDPDAIAAASHALKGMTVLVGATALTDLLQALERQARAGPAPAPPAGLEPLFARVMAEVARAAASHDGAPGP